MFESGKTSRKVGEKIDCESDSEYLKPYTVPLQKNFFDPRRTEHLYQVQSPKNSDFTKQNDHDMLQASQADLKRSNNYTNNIKQVINLNSSIQERYQKLQNISLHHILNKGNVCTDIKLQTPCRTSLNIENVLFFRRHPRKFSFSSSFAQYFSPSTRASVNFILTFFI